MDFRNDNIWLMQGDCLERMKEIPDGSVDMVLTDPPYGTTACKWDSIIPLEPMWEQLKRIVKPNGAIVMTASQPFTSILVCSNLKWFKYDTVYEKSHATGHLNANKMPMRKHESILVFYSKLPVYNPQKVKKSLSNIRPDKRVAKTSECYGKFDPNSKRTEEKDVAFPTSINLFNNSTTGGDRGLHPTQKPVALMEYLIKTYTNEGETVLDFTFGSGTTGVACTNLNRNFIGIELDDNYFNVGKERILNADKKTDSV
jgi:site-specific DNA-methyltransferase (adenine-specific)